MAYWWLLERKSFKDEPIKLTPVVGEKVQQAWLAGQAKIYLPHLKIAIDASDIKAIQPTTQVMPADDMYKLASGLGDDLETKPYGKGKPIYAPDFEKDGISYRGGVVCNWYKKNIDKREWDEYYGKCGVYYRIDDTDGACWVAMLLPEEQNSNKPDYLIRCSDTEDKFLDGKRNG